jgi:hypothetical protein
MQGRVIHTAGISLGLSIKSLAAGFSRKEAKKDRKKFGPSAFCMSVLGFHSTQLLKLCGFFRLFAAEKSSGHLVTSALRNFPRHGGPLR